MQSEQDIRTHILTKAEEDSEFRTRLLEDPKGTVEAELGVSVPDVFTFHIHEDTATDTHLVLPPDKRLEQEDLEAIAGGTWSSDPSGVSYDGPGA